MKISSTEHEAYLLRLLERGAYTRCQLEERLRRRGAAAGEAAALLDRLEGLGYVDDGLYARLYVESHPERGSLRLKAELRRRGVSERLIREALEERDEAAEASSALELAREWLDRGIEGRLVVGRLLRRGFSRSLVGSIMERLERKAP